MNFAVLQFPGSNCDQDVVHVLGNVMGHSARLLLSRIPRQTSRSVLLRTVDASPSRQISPSDLP